MVRSAVAIALPRVEFEAVRELLTDAGFEPVRVESPDQLARLLAVRRDVNVAVLDCENDLDGTLEMYACLHEGGQNVPTLMLMPPKTVGRMGLGGRADAQDEYFTRPYSAEALRWRIEAMLIRVENVIPEESAEESAERAAAAAVAAAEGPATAPWTSIDEAETGVAPQRGKIAIVFNPKGGVGKTTISINLGAALQIHKNQRVLIVDCDTITGHIASSLGLMRTRTLATAWREDAGNNVEASVAQIASVHSSGVSVLILAESPLHTEMLEPRRVAGAILAARYFYDWVILDMHPDYGPLNQGLFEAADTIVVPVTPDVPCIRAAVQFREVASELGIRGRLTMVINRANSGVSGADVERVVAIPCLGRVRSAGMLFVRAADQGQTAVELFASAKVVGDIDRLADRLLSGTDAGSSSRSFPSRTQITDSVRGLFDRLSAPVS